jgi:hypothetical protein
MAAILIAMDGALGLHGWQWLALVEGTMTVAVGLILLWWLPPRPEAIKSLHEKDLAYISYHVSRYVQLYISILVSPKKGFMSLTESS